MEMLQMRLVCEGCTEEIAVEEGYLVSQLEEQRLQDEAI